MDYSTYRSRHNLLRYCAKRRRAVEKPIEKTFCSSKLHMANMQVQILVATSSSSSNPVCQSLWGKKGGVKQCLNKNLTTDDTNKLQKNVGMTQQC